MVLRQILKRLSAHWMSVWVLAVVLALPATHAWSWSLEEAAKPYKGSTLRVGIAVVPVIEGLYPLMTEDFAKRTGIKVEIEPYTHAEWDAKADADLYSHSGHFDLLMMHHERFQDWVTNKHVVLIDDFLKDPKLRDPNLDPEDFLQPLWDDYTLYEGKHRVTLPFMNFQTMYWYNKKAMDNPEEKAAFKKKYGYDLGPAKTLDQMRDIAEFFTRKKGETLAGEVLKSDHYGVGLIGKREESITWEWYAILGSWGVPVFDQKGRPNFNQPGAVEATKWWLDLRKFAPPGASEAGFIDLFVQLTKGQIAQALQWVDFAFAIDIPKISSAVNTYSYATIPTRKLGMSPGGWGEGEPLVISSDSKNKEAAYLLIQWLASREAQKKWIEGPGHGLPTRKSSMELPFVKKHPAFAPLLVQMRNGWFAPGFSGYTELKFDIAIQLTRAAAKEITVEQALEAIQKKALELTSEGTVNPGQPGLNQFLR